MNLNNVIILSYFKDLDLPLAEATRIQFISNFLIKNSIKYAFIRRISNRTYKSLDNILVRGLYSLIYIYPTLFIRANILKQDILIYGPADSRLLNFFEKTLNGRRIFTDGEDVDIALNKKSLHEFLYIGHPGSSLLSLNCLPPAIEKKWLENYSEPFQSFNIVSIGYMSHFSKRKGILDICNALMSLPVEMQSKIYFHVASNSVADERKTRLIYDTFCENFAGNVITKLKVNSYKFMKHLDIYIYPFHVRKNTFNVPLTLLEASLSGVFVVGPKFNNVQDWLIEECLVDPSSPDQIAGVISKCIEDKQFALTAIKDNNNIIKKSVKLVENNR